MSRFLSKSLSHSAEKFRRETFLICASENFWSRKKIRIRGGWGGGKITIFCQNFLSDSAEKLRRGTHQCVINFGCRKILGFRELCHDFVSKILSHSAEKFRRETFLICASEISWSRKKIRIRGGDISRFSVKTFCLTVPKNFVEETISVSLISGIERF